MKTLTGKNPVTLNPYLVIAFAAVAAYLPVSSMLLALKNDVVAIEYPIQHFLSESLRHGESPVWFNTWAMGFPLQSILSWSFFSTPQTIIGLLFGTGVHVLHIEFLLYIMASGWSMYRLLKNHFNTDKNFALVLSCCFMLSGFTVASSQWLLYITCMTFIPLLLAALLSLLKTPSLKHAILFAVFYFLLLTNVHIYITVIVNYLLFFFLFFFLLKKLIPGKNNDQKENINLVKFILLAFLFTFVLCAAPVYYTMELLDYLNRSGPLEANLTFFHSNYLHPRALSSLLLPLSSVKASFSNTEGTLLNSYIGLLPLILLPASLVIIKKQKNIQAAVFLIMALFFLCISFGPITPLREWMNILPGMSYFRNAGVLRVFFNLFLIIYLAVAFRQYKFGELITGKIPFGKSIVVTTGLLIAVCLLVFISHSGAVPGLYKNSLYETLKMAGANDILVFNSFTQLVLLLFLLLAFLRKSNLVIYLVVADLILNTLACTPYFTTGTYSVKEVNTILKSPVGFPVQLQSPGDVNATWTDARNNAWHNINTFRKQVSYQVSMTGPLFLKDVYRFLENPELVQTLQSKKLLFISDDVVSPTDSIIILQQKPNKIVSRVSLTSAKQITLQQSYFPGWKVYYNDSVLALSKGGKPFVSVNVPAGQGTLIFVFEKKRMVLYAILLHLIVISVLTFFLVKKFFPPFLNKRKVLRK